MSKRKRVIDIFPQKGAQVAGHESDELAESSPLQSMNAVHKEKSKASAFSIPWILKGGMASIIVSVFGLFALHIFFASATIEVQPESRELSIRIKITEEEIDAVIEPETHPGDETDDEIRTAVEEDLDRVHEVSRAHCHTELNN